MISRAKSDVQSVNSEAVRNVAANRKTIGESNDVTAERESGRLVCVEDSAFSPRAPRPCAIDNLFPGETGKASESFDETAKK